MRMILFRCDLPELYHASRPCTSTKQRICKFCQPHWYDRLF